MLITTTESTQLQETLVVKVRITKPKLNYDNADGPQSRIEKWRKIREEEHSKKKLNTFPYSKNRFMKRIGLSYGVYRGMFEGRETRDFHILLYRAAQDLRISIEWVMRGYGEPEAIKYYEPKMILIINALDEDRQRVVLMVWHIFGYYAMERMLND